MKAMFAALCLIAALMKVSTAISEDANAEIRFPSGTIDATEGQELMVCLILETTLAGGITSPLMVTFSNNLASGSTSASPADVMVASPAQIIFPVGDAPMGNPMTRCTSDFDIVDDSDQEEIEEFDIFIMSPTDCLGNPAFAQVNIQDNDNDPRIMLDMSAYMGAEGGSDVTVCAVLSNVLPVSGTNADISTSFVLTDGDAALGSDFTIPDPTEMNIVFTTGSMNGDQDCLTISILDDGALEGNHTFNVSLNPPASPATLTTPSSSPVIITDNEDVTVSLQMPVSATEGNVVTISVDLSNVPGDGLEVELVVTLSATSGTASKCVNTYVRIGSICPVFSSDLIFHSHGKIIPPRV